MSYFDDERHYTRRGGYLFQLLVALIGGVVGGFLFLAIWFLPHREVVTAPVINHQETPAQLQEASPPVISNSESPVIQIAARVGPAVVGIRSEGNVPQVPGHDFVDRGSGSGVIFDARGFIVTNYHVVEKTKKLTVTLADGRDFKARVIGFDTRSDLAVIKIDASGLSVAKFGDSSKLRVGEIAVAIGNPMGEEFAGSVTVGVISALNRTMNVEDRVLRVIQTDAAINPGNSGGALANSQGQIIGINSAKIAREDIEGMGFAIPISEVKPIIEELVTKGFISRPWLGIRGGSVPKEEVAAGKYPAGVFVAEAVKGGPAAKAGISSSDVITAINDRQIKSFEELLDELKKFNIGQTIKVKVSRQGQEKVFQLLLGEMPQNLN